MLVTRSLLIFLSRESKRNGAKCDLGGARSKKKGAMSEPFFSEGEATQQTFSEAEVRVVADSLSRQIRREWVLVTRSLLIFLSRESKRNGAKCDLGGARSKKKGAMSEPFFSEGEATQQTFSEAEVRVVADSLSRQIRRE